MNTFRRINHPRPRNTAPKSLDDRNRGGRGGFTRGLDDSYRERRRGGEGRGGLRGFREYVILCARARVCGRARISAASSFLIIQEFDIMI